MMTRLIVLLASAMLLSGCLLRAEVGTGLGLGAEAKVPGLLHTGLAHGRFEHHGWHYRWGRQSGVIDETSTVVLWHRETREVEGEDRLMHECFGLLPPLTNRGGDGDSWRDDWSLEVGVMLLFVDLRLGFNPFGALP